MAVLSSFQKITRVLPGMPFGSGADGAYSSATIPTLTKDSCSGTATSTTLTTAGSTFANGDILLIHQTRGTGAGQWEINKVASGGGSTSLTLQVANHYTYTDSGASQAQAIKIPQYTNVTVQSGTWTVPAWDGNVGGIGVFASKGTVMVTGNVTGASIGFRGTASDGAQIRLTGYQGEGTSGDNTTRSTSANGTGGGGGEYASGGAGHPGAGAGGGHALAGSNGGSGDPGVGGTQGAQGGSADLVTAIFGGSGAQGGTDQSNPATAGVGGNSGGGWIIFARNIVFSGTNNVNGANGTNSSNSSWGGGGGGGSGGFCLIACSTATLGSNLITATAGTGGTGGGTGGTGSVGRIAVHHSGTVTGTTNPSFTDITDGSLIEMGGSFIFSLI